MTRTRLARSLAPLAAVVLPSNDRRRSAPSRAERASESKSEHSCRARSQPWSSDAEVQFREPQSRTIRATATQASVFARVQRSTGSSPYAKTRCARQRRAREQRVSGRAHTKAARGRSRRPKPEVAAACSGAGLRRLKHRSNSLTCWCSAVGGAMCSTLAASERVRWGWVIAHLTCVLLPSAVCQLLPGRALRDVLQCLGDASQALGPKVS